MYILLCEINNVPPALLWLLIT